MRFVTALAITALVTKEVSKLSETIQNITFDTALSINQQSKEMISSYEKIEQPSNLTLFRFLQQTTSQKSSPCLMIGDSIPSSLFSGKPP
jgi:DNA replication protein DnaD